MNLSLEQNTVTIWLLKDFLNCHKLFTLLSSKPDIVYSFAIAKLAELGPLKLTELLPEYPLDPTLEVVENKRTTGNEFG